MKYLLLTLILVVQSVILLILTDNFENNNKVKSDFNQISMDLINNNSLNKSEAEKQCDQIDPKIKGVCFIDNLNNQIKNKDYYQYYINNHIIIKYLEIL